MTHLKTLLPGLVALLTALAFAASAAAQPKTKPGPNLEQTRANPKIIQAFRSVVAKPSESVCRILCDSKEAALGTIVDADGWILTKFSQLKGEAKVKLKDGREFPAKLIGVHEPNDLAMLKIEAKGLVPIQWADSTLAQVGFWVASPGLGPDPVGIGVVGVATRNIPPSRQPAPVNPNSGYLGISLEPKEGGPRVTQVMPDTAAAKAGVKADDQVLSVDGKPVDSPDALIALLQKYKPGDEVTLKLRRGDMTMELKATLGKRPANLSRGEIQNRMGSELSERRTGFPTILQHDIVIRPVDCGGPLVDLDGNVLGVNIARAGRTESYCVPSEVIRPLLPDLKNGKLPPPKVEEKPAEKPSEKPAEKPPQKSEEKKPAKP